MTQLATLLLKTFREIPDSRKRSLEGRRLVIALRLFENGEGSVGMLGENAISEFLNNENNILDAIGLIKQTETDGGRKLLSEKIGTAFAKLEEGNRGETLRRAMDALGEVAISGGNDALGATAADTIRRIVLKDGKYVWTHDELPPKRKRFLGIPLRKPRAPPTAMDYLFDISSAVCHFPNYTGFFGNNLQFAGIHYDFG